MAATAPQPPIGTTFRRLIGYARPYLAVLAAALLASSLYSVARTGRAYLIKPLLDEVALPHYTGQLGSAPSSVSGSVGSSSGWLGELRGSAEPAAAADPAPEPAPAEARAEAQARVRESFWNVILAGLLIVLVIPFAHFGQVYFVEYGLGRVLVDVQQTLCSKLLALPLSFHHQVARGDVLSRATNDATRAQVALKLLFGDVAQSVFALLIGFGMLLSISWQLTLTTLAVAPILAGVISIFGRRIRKTSRRRQESLGDVTARLVQILSGIKVIKAFRAGPHEENAFQSENLRYFRRSMKVVKNRVLSRTLVEGLNNAVGIGVLVLGTVAVGRGLWGLTMGSLAAFAAIMMTTYRPLKELTKGWNNLMDAIPAAERFFELLDVPGEPADTPDALRVDGVRQGIELCGVSFSYGREPVLEDVSVSIQAGQMVAIVGRTGSGKSTLADLLLRFYDPSRGRIELDGVDLRQIARDSWLDQVAVVTQEPFLFSGSIFDNILYGRPQASRADVEAAARAAHVDEFVDSLPEGFDTDVGEAGVRLSGGQRQRITIARAILRDPAILIFDEATSALDAKSERLVQDAIRSLLVGRTVFVIAHRLSTIRHADQILVLEKGHVVETGRHEDLMARSGLYGELMAAQTSSH